MKSIMCKVLTKLKQKNQKIFLEWNLYMKSVVKLLDMVISPVPDVPVNSPIELHYQTN